MRECGIKDQEVHKSSNTDKSGTISNGKYLQEDNTIRQCQSDDNQLHQSLRSRISRNRTNFRLRAGMAYVIFLQRFRSTVASRFFEVS